MENVISPLEPEENEVESPGDSVFRLQECEI
jgi:hypothetical protein